MRFCINCGKQIALKAKFCPSCGERVEIQDQAAPEVPVQPESPEVVRDFALEEISDPTYLLLEKGRVFAGYAIVRMLNKEPEGIKYIAEKDGKEYVLKLFFKTEFSNLDTAIKLQKRLKRINKLDTAHTARVVEVNQNHDPAYMVSEFIKGESLAQIKTKDPERLTENYVREIARKLIHTAIAVRKNGLTLTKLTPSGIMVEESGKITVLSSGVSYEEVDEREEVFNIGVILAQLLSKNVIYKSIYNTQRLRDQKFAYIAGTSIGLNKVLADCLHRNILHRYTSLENLLKGLDSLPPVERDVAFITPGSPQSLSGLKDIEPPKPRAGFDWKFYGLVFLIALALGFLFYYVLPKMASSGPSGGGTAYLPTLIDDTTSVAPTELRNGRERRTPQENEALQTGVRDDPRRQTLASDRDYNIPQAPVKVKAPIPENFVHVPDGSYGFNRLKENPNHNVSQDGFYISRGEVTQEEWNQYMMPASVSFAADRVPVDNVSWMRIIRYCNARSENEGLEPAYKITGSTAKSITCNFSANGYRLPTESEWEMAAKAGALYAYSGSDDPDEVAWYRDNSSGRIRIGGSKTANAYGIYDMSGNVAEWCWDWYDPSYPNTLSTFINPTGPGTGNLKVIRGGSVRNGEGTNLGILYRDKGDPARGYQFVGFRLVRNH